MTRKLICDDQSGRESSNPWYWTVDDDRERIYRGRAGNPPFAISHEFDTVVDMESSNLDLVFAVDSGDDYIAVINMAGKVITTLKGDRYESPKDVGVDDYARLYVYDADSKRVVELVPKD